MPTRIFPEAAPPTKPYSAPVTIAEKTPTVLSTHPVHVILACKFAFSKGWAITVKLNGVGITGFNMGTETNSQVQSMPIDFIANAGDVFEWEGVNCTSVEVRTKILNE